MQATYDVVVVGGGAAGLGAALTLARARRSVLVVDSGQPRNAPAGNVHNYLGREGTPPGELLSIGRSEVVSYGGEIVSGEVSDVTRRDDDDGFDVVLADGSAVSSRRLLVTTGLVDELPDVPGVADRWGHDVVHCPYCHGWEIRDQTIGVLGTSPLAVHQALLFRQWSADVTLVLHTAPPPSPDELQQLEARGVTVVEGEAAALEVVDDHIAGIRLRSGELVVCEAVAVQTRMTARAGVFESLGVKTAEMEMAGQVVATYVAADPNGATDVPGIWVAGNVADARAQVIGAAAAGTNAAAAVNADLVADDARRAVAATRAERRD